MRDVRVQTFDAIRATSRQRRISVDLGQRIAARHVTRGGGALPSFEDAIYAESIRFARQGADRLLLAGSLHEDRAGQPEQRGEGSSVVQDRMVLDNRRDPEVTPVSHGPRTAGVATKLSANEVCIFVRVLERY